jgi:6,7-dimethyl-8-ribityllumazine synthase
MTKEMVIVNMKIIIPEKTLKNFFPIAIIVSRFNEEITNALHDGAVERARELGFPENYIHVVWVPGAVEIPLIAQTLARSEKFAAIICLGAVIRGDTSHYDYVCQQVSFGCQKVALENNIPIIFGVLTTDNEEQARERAGGSHGNKGWDAVNTAVEMISITQRMLEF